MIFAEEIDRNSLDRVCFDLNDEIYLPEIWPMIFYTAIRS